MSVLLARWSDLLVIVIVLALGKPTIVAGVERAARALGIRHGQIVPGRPSPAQLAVERSRVYLVLTDPLVLLLLVGTGGIRLAPDRFTNVAGTFVALFLWVDIWMYANHVAMHRLTMISRWHRHHHLSTVPHARSALSFSLAEKLVCYTLGWQLGAAILSHLMNISLYGLGLFYVFYFVASAMAHANFEFLHRGADFGRFRLLGSSTSHALHHVLPARNFGFFTTIYDRLFGTAATGAEYATAQGHGDTQ